MSPGGIRRQPLGNVKPSQLVMKLAHPVTASIFLCLLPQVTRALSETEATIPPIRRADSPYHDFVVNYGSGSHIDIRSLGDDDIIIGYGTLFDPQLGGRAFHPEFQEAVRHDETETITATYRIPRPDDGWASWNLSKLTVRIASGGILDLQGREVPSSSLGTLQVVLESVPQLAVQLTKFPIVVAGSNSPATFEIHYQANYALQIELLDHDEIQAQVWTPELHDDGTPKMSLFGNPIVNVHNIATRLLSAQHNGDGTAITASYALDPPQDGWVYDPSSQPNEARINVNLRALGANAPQSTQLLQGSYYLGRLIVIEATEVTALLDAGPRLAPGVDHVPFEIEYQSRSAAIDIETLGDDDIGTSTINFETGRRIVATFNEILSIEDEGKRVRASYTLERPAGGWLQVGGEIQLGIAALENGVRTMDGLAVIPREIGLYHFDVGSPDAVPQLAALDEWFSQLGDALGSEDAVTITSDHDSDGLTDMVEFMVGTDPLDPTHASPVTSSLAHVDGEAFLQLHYAHRVSVRGAVILLEGSETGETWLEASSYFTPTALAVPDGQGLRAVTMRSRLPISELSLRLYRLRVVPSF